MSRAVLPTPVRQPAPKPPKMTSELHEYVRRRDRMCFLYRLDRGHCCQNAFSVTHSPTALHLLTVDHFWLKGKAAGVKPPNDKYHLVAMCCRGNVAGPSHEVREREREYIRDTEAPVPEDAP